MKFGVIDNLIFVAYLIVTLMIGWYFKNKSKSADDYILADRKLGLSVLIATFVATSVGGGTLNGWIGKVYEQGLVVVPTMLVLYLIAIAMALFLSQKLRNFGGYTAPEVLGRTYGKESQLLGGIFSMIYLIGTGPALQAIALGTVLNVVLGVPFTYGAIIAMAIIIFYTYFSGMWGVAMTDYAQFIIMAIGVGLAGIFALNRAGGWEGIVAAAPESHFNMGADVKSTIELVIALALPVMIDGNRYQRFFSARDAKTAKKGGLIAVIPWHLFYMLVLILGLSALVLLPGLKADKVFPTMLLTVLPVGIKGLVFASLVSAIMSTADSYTLVAATNFVQDIYKPYINPNATDEQIVKMTRRAVVVLGILGLFLALMIPSIMGIWTLASTAYVSGCFVPIMYALFFKGKKSPKASMSAILLGSGIGLILKVTNMTILNQPAIVIGVITSLLAFIIVGSLDKHEPAINS